MHRLKCGDIFFQSTERDFVARQEFNDLDDGKHRIKAGLELGEDKSAIPSPTNDIPFCRLASII